MRSLAVALLWIVGLGLVAFALLAGGGTPAYAWSYPAALNTNAGSDSGDDWYPQVTTDGLGNWVAVWGSPSGIVVARSTDNGATWTDPAAIGSGGSPQVTTDGLGNWVAVWQSSGDILAARSTDNGATWTAPAPVKGNGDSDMSPQVTTDGLGNWVAVWESTDDLGGTIGGDLDILVSRSTDNGVNWTPSAALNTNAGHDGGHDKWCQVTTDGLGNWVAVWNSNTNLGGNDGPDWDILVARSTDNGASWTTLAALSSYAFVDSGGEVMPQVATDGGGNWVAVWRAANSLVDGGG